MQSRIFNFKILISAPFLLSLIIIINCVRNKFLLFPPSFLEVAIFSFAVAATAFIVFRAALFVLKDKNKASVFVSLTLPFIFFYNDFFYTLFDIKFIYYFIYSFLFQKFHLTLLVLGIALLSIIFLQLKKTKRQLNYRHCILRCFFFCCLLLKSGKYFSAMNLK